MCVCVCACVRVCVCVHACVCARLAICVECLAADDVLKCVINEVSLHEMPNPVFWDNKNKRRMDHGSLT